MKKLWLVTHGEYSDYGGDFIFEGSDEQVWTICFYFRMATGQTWMATPYRVEE